MPKNVDLKIAIVKSGRTQIELAGQAGIREDVFSKIVNGHIEPSDDQKKHIAEVLGQPVAQLFPEVAA